MRLAVVNGVGLIGQTLGLLLGALLNTRFPMTVTYYAYALVNALVILLVLAFVKETAGKRDEAAPKGKWAIAKAMAHDLWAVLMRWREGGGRTLIWLVILLNTFLSVASDGESVFVKSVSEVQGGARYVKHGSR